MIIGLFQTFHILGEYVKSQLKSAIVNVANPSAGTCFVDLTLLAHIVNQRLWIPGR